MWINSCFDGGNIEVIELTRDRAARLAIRPDTAAEFLQWFYFRLGGIKGKDGQTLTIANAGEASYPKGWEELPRGCQSRPSRLVPGRHSL